MPDWTFYRHSGILACPLSRHMLHDQSRDVCPCPCCMSMSILHVHVHVACPCQCCMSMSMSMYIYIEMPACRTIRHPVSPVPDWKEVRYRTKLTQLEIFLVQYQTKIRDARMPMPALVSSMLMLRYGCYVFFVFNSDLTFRNWELFWTQKRIQQERRQRQRIMRYTAGDGSRGPDCARGQDGGPDGGVPWLPPYRYEYAHFTWLRRVVDSKIINVEWQVSTRPPGRVSLSVNDILPLFLSVLDQ
jgi:hypothetical protein